MGNVLVASPGIVDMKFDDGGQSRMLSVRMVVENNEDDAPWTVDTREQRAAIRGGGESVPAYVNTEGNDTPLVQISRGEKRTIDLYYPLPANAKDAEHVPEFDLLWQVRTGERVVAERTPFERLRIEAARPEVYVAWGTAPYWWYDPWWPGPTYIIAPTFHHHHARPIYVRPASVGGGVRPSVPVPARRVR